MYKVLRTKFRSCCATAVMALVVAMLTSHSAMADLRDDQSFKPIEWESDFVHDNALSFTALRVVDRVLLAQPDEVELFRDLQSAFGIQLGQWLRDHWQGRISLFLARTGSQTGAYVWSFLGSDLKRALIPESMYSKSPFHMLRPSIFFGLGFASRWENSQVRYNLIPTFRYETSEPSATAGLSVDVRLTGEILLSLETRYFQSARISRNRFISWGGSIVWGGLDKR